jgi:hypothetical protein
MNVRTDGMKPTLIKAFALEGKPSGHLVGAVEHPISCAYSAALQSHQLFKSSIKPILTGFRFLVHAALARSFRFTAELERLLAALSKL